MLSEVQDDGKGDSVRNGLKEAGWQTREPMDKNCITRKRVPEAESPGELAPHNKAPRFRG